ncbi:aminoglycoside phosphotransferase family protein [Nocardia sp. NPDC052254]|uniref:aminoglycoside phosphotransferase family protein n=1 Tax=Nocardia sp. NPDC052254 TaxID=3155681 RepID=UPI00342A7C44
MIRLPKSLAHSKIAASGVTGREWIAGLPELLDGLVRQWSCVPDGPVAHGQVGIVVPVRRRSRAAVIKVSFPRWADMCEADAYEVWDGAGAVRLYERADDRFAMMLERGGGALASAGDEEALTIQGRLTRRLAVDAPAHLPQLSHQMSRWEREIRTATETLDHHLPRAAIDAALTTLREWGPHQPNTLVHGDLHDANILASGREPWLAIDPRGQVGDPAYDAFNVIRSPRFAPLLATADPRPGVLRLLDIYCAAADIDVEWARRWTQAGAVHEALWGRAHGDPGWLVHATDRLALALT